MNFVMTQPKANKSVPSRHRIFVIAIACFHKWWDGHVGKQNNSKISNKFCKIIESNSQQTSSLLSFIPTWPPLCHVKTFHSQLMICSDRVWILAFSHENTYGPRLWWREYVQSWSPISSLQAFFLFVDTKNSGQFQSRKWPESVLFVLTKWKPASEDEIEALHDVIAVEVNSFKWNELPYLRQHKLFFHRFLRFPQLLIWQSSSITLRLQNGHSCKISLYRRTSCCEIMFVTSYMKLRHIFSSSQDRLEFVF